MRVALGILFVLGGFLWLLAKTLLADWVGLIEQPYLPALLSRSLEDPFRLGLLAAVLSVLPHAVWIGLRRNRVAEPRLVEEAYDRAGLFMQTLFTSFGFLGTIVGVSIAVSGLEAAMENREPAALIGGLGTAFDTTFLGLCGAILVMLTRRLVSLYSATEFKA